jgi:hypothetical protein
VKKVIASIEQHTIVAALIAAGLMAWSLILALTI